MGPRPKTHMTNWIRCLRHAAAGVSAAVLLMGPAVAADAIKPENSADVSALSVVAEQLSKYFQRYSTFEFSATQETVIPSSGERFTETLSYVGAGQHYKYAYSDGTPSFTCEMAFNGEYGQSWDKENNMLHLKKEERMSDGTASNVLGVLAPFQFLTTNDLEGNTSARRKFSFPTLTSLGDAEQWRRRVHDGVTAETISRDGRPLLCVTMPGGVMYGRKFDTTYRVFFDPKRDYLPVEWERASTTGETREVYKVEEFGSVKTNDGGMFTYPKTASRLKYLDDDKAHYCETIITVSDVRVGEQYDMDMFTIDPSVASVIHDIDANTYITVPK